MRKEDIQFEISEKAGTVNGILTEPPDAKALLLLAHGAGAGMQHKTMQLIADCLAEENIATLRFNFSYIEKGRKSPDSSKIAQETITGFVVLAQHRLLLRHCNASRFALPCRCHCQHIWC